MKELYAGVDIHRDNYVGCIIDDKKNIVVEKCFPPTKEGAQSFFCGMPVKAVAIEACEMWRAALKLFREQGYEVKLTSPQKTKDIAGKKKTDKIDAKTLANLLRTGFLPEVYIPNDEMLKLRGIHKDGKYWLNESCKKCVNGISGSDLIERPQDLRKIKAPN